VTLRTPAMEKKYQKAKANNDLEQLNEIAPIKQWKFWKLVPNRFPHDRHHTENLMVVLKRECPSFWDIALHEQDELFEKIGPYLDDKYDYIKINLASVRSINNVPHIQVYVLKGEYK